MVGARNAVLKPRTHAASARRLGAMVVLPQLHACLAVRALLRGGAKLYGLAELPREFSRLVPLARARMSAPQWRGRSDAVYLPSYARQSEFFFSVLVWFYASSSFNPSSQPYLRGSQPAQRSKALKGAQSFVSSPALGC